MAGRRGVGCRRIWCITSYGSERPRRRGSRSDAGDPARRSRRRGRGDPGHPDHAAVCCDDPPAPDTDAVYDAPVERAVRAFQQSRGLTVDGRGERGDLAGARRRPLDARAPGCSPTSSPSRCSATTSAQLQERLLEMGYDLGRADGIFGRRTAGRAGPVPARGRPGRRRRVRPADDGRAAPARPQGDRRPAATCCARPSASARPARRWSTSASSSTPATAAATPASACPTACCAGPRPTSRTTSPPGSRAGSPRPACGCT